VGGSGPPLLLLHGYPQTLAMWKRVAPILARSFTVVATDLRGYGDSDKPPTDARHAPYSKRALAADQVLAMRSLCFDRFFLAAHDRGARVAHRLTLDHPDAVERLALLNIAPTLDMYEGTDLGFAISYYHWFLLIQPGGLPERLLSAEPEFFLRHKLGSTGGGGTDPAIFTAAAMAEYIRCFSDPATIHATCEEYRAGASIDLEHDRATLDEK